MIIFELNSTLCDAIAQMCCFVTLQFYLQPSDVKVKSQLQWRNIGWGAKPTQGGGGTISQATAPQLPRPTNAAQSFETFKKQAEERKRMSNLLEEQRRMEKEQQERSKQEQAKQKQRLVVIKYISLSCGIIFPLTF